MARPQYLYTLVVSTLDDTEIMHVGVSGPVEAELVARGLRAQAYTVKFLLWSNRQRKAFKNGRWYWCAGYGEVKL